MKKIIVLTVILYICIFSSLLAKERANIIVAENGSGKFSKMQNSIDSIPVDNKQNVIILIRKGVFH